MMDRQQHPSWEQRTIEKIALEGIKEQKRRRRWGIFFKLLAFTYFSVLVWLVFTKAEQTSRYDEFGRGVLSGSDAHIAMVRLTGVIAENEQVNSTSLNYTLRRAMSKPTSKGVLLLANSPGGSPVQSSLIYKNIVELKKQYKKPIITVVTDACASGCYYIVSATDEIYADESSLVGSIGVISQSFGYAQAAEKLGLDPRTFIAGDNKDFLNPARPLHEKEKALMNDLLATLHGHFIKAVKAGRGDRLSEDEQLFSGLFWSGDRAQALGLIDGLATPQAVVQKMGDYPVYDYTERSPLDQLMEKLGLKATSWIKTVKQSFFSPSPMTIELK